MRNVTVTRDHHMYRLWSHHLHLLVEDGEWSPPEGMTVEDVLDGAEWSHVGFRSGIHGDGVFVETKTKDETVLSRVIINEKCSSFIATIVRQLNDVSESIGIPPASEDYADFDKKRLGTTWNADDDEVSS